MTFEGLGSMSGMLIIITIITIGAVMALRSKLRENSGLKPLDKDGKKPSEAPEPEPREDVQDQLDDLNKELDKD
ncbi:uncharacterized protein METZ01_LOCUS283442 [marine metagenome]|uniref:Uncharacterized protein n=1 Tax=marine metagenome TaxID=408172 RepID=A0A382L0V6_9ZZZZ